jgi:hypothetical protein
MYYGLKSLLIRRTLALEKCNGAFYAPLSQLLSLGGLLRRGEVNSYASWFDTFLLPQID